MQKINELKLAKELIRFPSITPIDAGVMKFLEKKIKKTWFQDKNIRIQRKRFFTCKKFICKIRV